MTTKFSVADPQREWMANGLKEFIYDNLNSNSFKQINFFNHNLVVKNFEDFCKGDKRDTSFQLFQIITFIFFIKFFLNYKYED